MAKNLFNDHELYLLEHWADAQLLEESMNRMRKKYAMTFSQVLDRVAARHKELNHRRLNIGEPLSDSDGGYINVGIGRKTWPSRERRAWPSGLWMGSVLLEDLKSEQRVRPYGTVWINPPENSKIDLEDAAQRLEDNAGQILGKLESRKEVDHSDGSAGIEYRLPESPDQLLKLLLKDESQQFIESMVCHFELLAKFIPILDDIFQGGKRSRK